MLTASDEVVWEKRLGDGDVFVLGPETNIQYKHAVPKEGKAGCIRFSIIYRSVACMDLTELKKGAVQRAETKKRKRSDRAGESSRTVIIERIAQVIRDVMLEHGGAVQSSILANIFNERFPGEDVLCRAVLKRMATLEDGTTANRNWKLHDQRELPCEVPKPLDPQPTKLDTNLPTNMATVDQDRKVHLKGVECPAIKAQRQRHNNPKWEPLHTVRSKDDVNLSCNFCKSI